MNVQFCQYASHEQCRPRHELIALSTFSARIDIDTPEGLTGELNIYGMRLSPQSASHVLICRRVDQHQDSCSPIAIAAYTSPGRRGHASAGRDRRCLGGCQTLRHLNKKYAPAMVPIGKANNKGTATIMVPPRAQDSAFDAPWASPK